MRWTRLCSSWLISSASAGSVADILQYATTIPFSPGDLFDNSCSHCELLGGQIKHHDSDTVNGYECLELGDKTTTRKLDNIRWHGMSMIHIMTNASGTDN